MKSNYKRLGDYIEVAKVRNNDLKAKELLGININKHFMPSVANIVGTDLSNYKLVSKNQFACNRMHVGRDYRIPIAVSKSENPFMVSPAYDVFEIKDTKELMPEYLMMWFERAEFDRNAWFYTDADVRGGLPWQAFEDMQLPVPHISKQREIVNEYNTIQNRIALNQQMIQKLEETAQAIYREWFVEGIDRENLPEGWRVATLNELVEIIDGDRGANYPSIEEMTNNGYCLFLNAGNVTKIGFDFSDSKFITKDKDESLRKGKLKRNDVVLTTRGTVGNVAFYSDAILINNIRINSGMVILRAKDIAESTIFIYSILRNSEMKIAIDTYLSGSAQPQLPIKDLIKIPILKPSNQKIIEYSKLAIKIQLHIDNIQIQNQKLMELKELLLTKLTKVEG